MIATSKAIRLLAAMICAALLTGTALAAEPAAMTLSPVDKPLPPKDVLLRDGTLVTPQDWRALSDGRTLWYFYSDGLWGRELYRPNDSSSQGGMVTFEHRGGLCLDGRWTHAAGLYCFDFGGGPPHCFQHLRWQNRLFAISVSGDVQEVKRIDRSGVSCGAPPMG